MKSELIKQIEQYKPFNEQEIRDRQIILDELKKNEKIFSRESQMSHMTASAWVTNKNRDKILMVYHNLYDSWSWLGGHADGEEDLLQVALREVREESGLKNLTPISEEIYSLEVLTVDGHRKKGEYVSSHLHFNITYLLEADDREVLSIKPDENSGVAWFGLDKAVASSSEKWFREHIYNKLNMKLQRFLVEEENRMTAGSSTTWDDSGEVNEKIDLDKEEMGERETPACQCGDLIGKREEIVEKKVEKVGNLEARFEDRATVQENSREDIKEERGIERVEDNKYIKFGGDRLPLSDIKSYGISTSETKCYVKIYEQILDNHKLKQIFSSGYMWNGKKQKVDISAEEYFDRAKKIARVYGYSVPTKTVLNKDGKVIMYCRKAGKLSLEEDFISCPVKYLYIETKDGQRREFFEDKIDFRIYDKLKELDIALRKINKSVEGKL